MSSKDYNSYEDPVIDTIQVERALLDSQEETDKETEQAASPVYEETKGNRVSLNGTVTNTIWLNVRKRPVQGSEVVEIIQRGDKVEILEQLPEHYKVRVKNSGKIGYIPSKFCEEE